MSRDDPQLPMAMPAVRRERSDNCLQKHLQQGSVSGWGEHVPPCLPPTCPSISCISMHLISSSNTQSSLQVSLRNLPHTSLSKTCISHDKNSPRLFAMWPILSEGICRGNEPFASGAHLKAGPFFQAWNSRSNLGEHIFPLAIPCAHFRVSHWGEGYEGFWTTLNTEIGLRLRFFFLPPSRQFIIPAVIFGKVI